MNLKPPLWNSPAVPGDGLGDVVLAVLDLAAHAHDMDVVGELVVDREVIVALAAFGFVDHLAAAHAHGSNGMGADGPAGDVKVVHVLLDDVVAAEPDEMVPVAKLVLGVAPVRLPLVGPDRPLVPVDAARGDVSDGPLVNPLHARDVAGFMPALGAGNDGQLLLLGLLVGGQNLADAGGVDADGLLGEEVLAGLDGRLDVLGPEARRRGQHHQVAAIDHFLVGVEADEAALVGDVELLLGVFGIADGLAAVLEVILEHVGQGMNLDVVRRACRLADVVGRARAPAAAADQAHLDGVVALGMGVGQKAKAGRGRGRRLEKVTAIGRSRSVMRFSGSMGPIRDARCFGMAVTSMQAVTDLRKEDLD